MPIGISIADLFATMGLDASGFTEELRDAKAKFLSSSEAIQAEAQKLAAELKLAVGSIDFEESIAALRKTEAAMQRLTDQTVSDLNRQKEAEREWSGYLNQQHSLAIEDNLRLEGAMEAVTASVVAGLKRQEQAEREWIAVLTQSHTQAIEEDRAREASMDRMTAAVVRDLQAQLAAEREWAAYMTGQHQEALREDKERTASNNSWFGNRVGWMQRMILHMAAFTVAFKAFQAIEEGLGDFANLQKAEIALTHMLGSADEAREALDKLKVISLSDALDFQHLVKAQQRFSEFGVESARIPPILEAAANTAAAMNKPFDEVSNSLERMTESGVANARQLATIGISLKDLGEVLGIASTQVAEVFKDLTPTQRAEAFTAVLGKLGGIAKEVAGTLGGEWQITKNKWVFAMIEMAASVEPLLKNVVKFLGYVAKPNTTPVSSFGQAVDAYTRSGPDFTISLGRQPKQETEADLKAAAAKVLADNAARKAYEEMVRSEIALNNQVVALLNSQADTYEEYVARLGEGGRTAKASLSAIQTEIQRVSSEMLNLSGQPLKDAKELIVWLEDAKIKARDFADQDMLPKLEEDRLKSLDKALQFFGITLDGSEAKVAKARDAFNTIKAEWMLGEASIEAVTQAQVKLNEVMGADFLEKALTGIGLLNERFEKTNQSLAAQRELLRSPEFAERSRQVITDLGSTDQLKKVLDATRLQDAYHTLGVKTQEELDRLAAKALEAFNIIQSSGTASAWTIQQAWLRSFEAQMDAGQKFTFFQVLGASLIADNSRSASSKLLSVARETSREITRLTRELASSLVDNLAKVFDSSGNDSIQKQLDGLESQRKDHEAAYVQDVKDTQDQIDKIRASAGTSIAANRSAASDVVALQGKLAKEKAAYDKFTQDTKAQSDELRKQFQSTWDKIGAAFERTVEGFAKALAKFAAQKVIESALAAPLASLGKTLAGLAGIGGSIAGAVGGSAASVAGTGGLAGIGGVVGGIAGPGAADIAKYGGTATSTTTSAASSVFGAIGGISAAVGAVSSIIGNFQSMAMNKSLDLIEKSTRYSELYLFNLNAMELQWLPKLDYLLPIWGSILELPNRIATAPVGVGSGDTYIFQAGSISINGGTSLTQEVVADVMTQAVRKLKISKGLRQ